MNILPESLRDVEWKATVQLNLLRSAAAGIVWAVVTLVVSEDGTAGGNPWWALPLVVGIGYWGAVPMFFLAAKIMRAFAGDAGNVGIAIVSLILALGVAVGDPVVYAVWRKRKDLVPVDHFKPFNLKFCILVMGNATAPVAATSKEF